MMDYITERIENNHGGYIIVKRNLTILNDKQVQSLPVTGGVYIVTCNVTGLSYIGSSQNIKARVIKHITHPDCKEFKVLFKTYPLNKFTFSVIEHMHDYDLQHARIREAAYMLLKDTLYPNGYNRQLAVIRKCRIPELISEPVVLPIPVPPKPVHTGHVKISEGNTLYYKAF